MAYKLRLSIYRKKLLVGFFLIFILFSVVVTVFQYQREIVAKENVLIEKLDTYTEFTETFITGNRVNVNTDASKLDSLVSYFPNDNVRLTLIRKDGLVLYDSDYEDFQSMDNHSGRPEVKEALKEGTGHETRRSATTKKEYFYFAKANDGMVIRTAILYDISIKKFLRVDSVFVITILLMFLLAVIIVFFLSDKLGKSISRLQQFAEVAAKGHDVDVDYKFPNDELGAIGQQIVKVYNRLQKAKDDLNTERNRLLRHLQITQEGIAIFSKEKKQLIANNHFVQFVNIIADETAVKPEHIFETEEFKPVVEFIEAQQKLSLNAKDEVSTNTVTIMKNSMFYVVRAIVFQDKSFEVSISDVTEKEKEKKLKQQMTSNIAHELKTPVSSILGYLETLLTNKVEKEKRTFFIERSYIQSQRLSSLIQDISLLNKIEEASDLFMLETINVCDIVHTAIDELSYTIKNKNINVAVNIDEDIEINGNRSVLFSIWRNLIENSVKYAGEGVTIRINNYLKDDQYLYFSFSDNGSGIPEEHLGRIFERFYRVDSGRSRSMGGTGLGLSIVKNGVIFHKGEITVKNLKIGGVEFLFSIARDVTKHE